MASVGGAIKAGAAYVSLFTDNSRLVAGLRAASARLQVFGAAISAMGARLVGLGAQMVAPFAFAAKMFADTGSALLDMSQRTGVSVEALSELSFAAGQSGATVEQLEASLKIMSRTIGSGGMSLDARLEEVADQLMAIPDPAARAARAMEIFGRGGTALLPMFAQGAQGVRALRQEAARLGLTWSTEEASRAEAFGDTLSTLWAVLKRGVTIVGGALEPVLKPLVLWITEAAQATSRWISDNRGLVTILLKAVAGITAVGLGMMVLGPLISIIGVAFGLVVTVIGLVASSLAFMLTPMGFALKMLDSLVTAFFTFTSAGQRSVRSVIDVLREMAGTFQTTWGGIISAMRRGDLALSARIGWAGVQLAWEQGISPLRQMWREFVVWFENIWHTAITSLALSLNALQVGLQVGSGLGQPGMEGGLGVLQSVAIGGTPGGGLGQLGLPPQQNQIVAQGAAVQAQLLQAHNQFMQQLNQAGAASVNAGNSIARLQEELNRLAITAAKPEFDRLGKKNKDALTALLRGGGPQAGLDDAAKRIDVAGTFSGSAAGGLALGSTLAQRTATGVEQTRDEVRGLRRDLRAHDGLPVV